MVHPALRMLYIWLSSGHTTGGQHITDLEDIIIMNTSWALLFCGSDSLMSKYIKQNYIKYSLSECLKINATDWKSPKIL